MDTQLADALPGSLLSGRYRVRDRMAHHGVTTVFAATDERLDRPVTIKLVHHPRSSAPGFVDRFLDQSWSLARLTHPHLVAVYDQGSYQGLPYLVTEHVGGRTLREVLDSRRLTPVEALAVFEQMLSATAAAHRAGLVHRDLRPDAVLVLESPAAGPTGLVDSVVKVTDFGVAQAVENAAGDTSGQPLVSAAGYLPPELVTTGSTDPRGDVYSAGIVMYEMLTGQLPFQGSDLTEVAWQHAHQDVPPPSSRVVGVPPVLDELVTWATSRDPARRPSDAGILLARVQAVREEAIAAMERPYLPVDSTMVLSAVPAERPAWARLPASRPAPAERRPDRHRGERRRSGRVHRSGSSATAARPPGSTWWQRILANQRQRQALIAAVVVVGLLVAVGGWWIGIGRWMPAPQLVGMPAEQAQSEAARLGLSVTMREPVHDLTVPADHVLSQHPTDRVAKGGSLTLTLSLGPELHQVPDVIGAQLEHAVRQLEALGLTVEPGEDGYSDTVPEGRVLAVSPEVGEEISAGGTVTVSTSKGRSPLRVPLLLEKPKDAAVAELQQLGLTPVVEQVDSDQPAGEVIRQDPPYDTGVEAGATVTIEVSNGPPTKPVPNVTNQKCDKARKQVEDAGFRVSLPSGKRGRVVVQTPSPGTGLPPGSEVTIWCLG